MTDLLVNGYLVVSPREPGTTYQGPDRSPWEHIEQGFYEGELPETIRSSYASLRSDNSRGLWWPTCRDLGLATVLAAYSRKAGKSVEIIAIYSEYLAQSPDRVGWREPRARLLGVDVVAVGEWSLIRALLEARDPACAKVVGTLNEAGLLPDLSCASFVRELYTELARANLVEPIADPGSGVPVEAIRVYDLDAGLSRVSTPHW